MPAADRTDPVTAPGRPPWTFVALVALYLLAFPYHPKLRSPNELSRLWQARAIVDHGTFALDDTIRELGPVGDLATHDGRLYPSKAPLLSVLAAPIYAAQKWAVAAPSEEAQVWWARLLLTVLPTLLLLVALRRALRMLARPAIADALVLTYGAGSLAFSYSLLFMSHQPTAVLLSCAFLSLLQVHAGRWGRGGWLLGGLLAGLAITAEYTAALGIAVLVVFGAWSAWERAADGARGRSVARAFVWASVGALVPVACLLAYHHACFGHPFHTGYRTLADRGYQQWHEGGLAGIGLPDAGAAFLSFFSPLRGLFVLAPFLLLAPLGLLELHARGKARPEWRVPTTVLVVCAAVYAYFTSSFSYESWGWTTGPRHLTPWVPFLLPGVAAVLERFASEPSDSERSKLSMAAGLCAGSVLVTGFVSLVNYIPDHVSSPLFGLVVPLFRAADLPPSTLSLLGIPQPWAALPLLVLVAGIALDVLEQLTGAAGEASSSRARFRRGLITVVVVLFVHGSLARDTPADREAVARLRGMWRGSAAK